VAQVFEPALRVADIEAALRCVADEILELARDDADRGQANRSAKTTHPVQQLPELVGSICGTSVPHARDQRGHRFTGLREPGDEPRARGLNGRIGIVVVIWRFRLHTLLPSTMPAEVFFSSVHQLIVFAAAFVGGAINSVAGGGTLISFPTLIWLGVPSINANATNTLALWPGSLGSVWGYRRELKGTDPRVWALVVPSFVGGLAGAILLYRTPTAVFDRLVPWLILFATCLFMLQEPLQRRFNLTGYHPARSHWLSWTMLFQLVVGLYGGYFGAGIGILMLAALSIMGHTDIHQMNGVKNLLAVCINGIAAAYFLVTGLVVWQDAAVMAVGAIAGGIGGAGIARRAGRTAVRRTVIAIGFGMTLAMLLRL